MGTRIDFQYSTHYFFGAIDRLDVSTAAIKVLKVILSFKRQNGIYYSNGQAPPISAFVRRMLKRFKRVSQKI